MSYICVSGVFISGGLVTNNRAADVIFDIEYCHREEYCHRDA